MNFGVDNLIQRSCSRWWLDIDVPLEIKAPKKRVYNRDAYEALTEAKYSHGKYDEVTCCTVVQILASTSNMIIHAHPHSVKFVVGRVTIGIEKDIA